VKQKYESISLILNGINNISMFDSKHYVPILKWKPAERQALEDLGIQEKKFISPLIQLVMPQPKQPKKGEREKTQEEQLEEVILAIRSRMPEIPAEILKAWGNSPIFIDFSLLYNPSLRIEGLNQILTIGEKLGLCLIPVVNLSSEEEIKKVTSSLSKKFNHGLCLRIVYPDLIDIAELSQKIESFLKINNLVKENVDILVDLKETYEKGNKYLDFSGASQKIPHLLKWRTFIFASGAFPEDLTDCVVGENYRDRLDWKNWIEQMNSKKLERIPAFGDYTIQYPIYKESARFFTPSASIRYALEESWLIMRGQKGKSVQYLANASLLSQHAKFFGDSFSVGDKYIAEKGKNLTKHLKANKTGNATNWLTAGINHHLVCTAHQIANLP